MGFGKISNHRNFIKNIPVSVIQDDSGNKLPITNLSDGQVLVAASGSLTSILSTSVNPEIFIDMYASVDITNTDVLQNVWKKVGGSTVSWWSSLSSSIGTGSAAQANRLEYSGSQIRKFLCLGRASLHTTDTNTAGAHVDIAFAKNSSILSASISRTTMVSRFVYYPLSLNTITEMSGGDYMELWVRSNQQGGLTASFASFTLTRL